MLDVRRMPTPSSPLQGNLTLARSAPLRKSLLSQSARVCSQQRRRALRCSSFLEVSTVRSSSQHTSQIWVASASLAGEVSGHPDASRLVAVLLGYCVLVGSLFRSVPQIAKILRDNSVEGLSLTSFVVELFAYSITWAYNLNLGYPFSTYGDVVACWAQDLILIILILRLRNQVDLRVALGSLAFAAFTAALMTNVVGNQVLFSLQASTILLMTLGARVPQIVMNVKRGNSGQLSLITCGLNAAGCVSRMFTTFVLTKDALNFSGTALQLVMNSILLFQTVQTARALPGNAAVDAKLA